MITGIGLSRFSPQYVKPSVVGRIRGRWSKRELKRDIEFACALRGKRGRRAREAEIGAIREEAARV